MVYSCSKCAKTYKSKRWLDSHEATHTAAAPPRAGYHFTCSECQRSFKSAGGLKNHSRTHISLENPDPSSTSEQAVQIQCNADNLKDKSGETDSEASTEDEVDSGDIDEQAESLQCNITDDEEGNDLHTPSYFFEDDDELEEYLRSVDLGEDEASTSATVSKTSKKKTRKPALVKCNRCSKSYNSIDTYLKHKASHVMTDLYSHAPSREELKRKASEIVPNVLEEMGNLSTSIGFAMTIKDAAKVLKILSDSEDCSEMFSSIIESACDFFSSCDKHLIPSDLRMEFLKSTSLFSADKIKRASLVRELQGIVDINNEAANLFFAVFLRNFFSEIFAYFLHFVVHNGEDYVSAIPLSARFAVTSQPTDTLDFKQLMHYIGGANVKSLLRAAMRIKNKNNEWLKVVKVAKDHFLISELSGAPDSDILAWTEAQDRGGLTKINANLLSFFVELGATVKVLEHFDGSLLIDEVIEKVMESTKLIYLWEETMRGSVTQQQSLKLLHALCSYFCSTWQKGIVTRRLDELSANKESVGAKHGMGGVAFRASIH